MNVYLSEIGYNTRVVAFFSDKSEFKEEIDKLKQIANWEINRFNFRLGIVTDKDLIKDMKKSKHKFFREYGPNVMILQRYDGEIFKANLNVLAPSDYLWWIHDKSTKAVD